MDLPLLHPFFFSILHSLLPQSSRLFAAAILIIPNYCSQMMLSQEMHQYAPSSHFQPLPSSNGDIGPSTGIPHQSSVSSSSASSQKSSKQARHHHPYDSPQDNPGGIGGQQMNGSTTPIRRRISRACDQCNQLRTKCDGKLPCQHCVGEFFPDFWPLQSSLLQPLLFWWMVG